MNSWEKKWNKKEKNGTSVTYPLGIISKFGYDIAKINIQRVIKSVKLERNSMIIDIGCGEGRTLSYFSELGFEKLTGIDISKSAIEKCKSGNFKGSAYVMDANATKFKNKQFDLVFSEGLLEHFDDFTPVLREMARLSKKYIILVQPNHSTILGKVLNLLMEKFSRSHEKEYDYKISDFIKAFSAEGFHKVSIAPTHFNSTLTSVDTSCIILLKRNGDKN